MAFKTKWGATYNQNDEEKEENIGDILELEPEVLWDEGQRGVLSRPNLVASELVHRGAVLVE